MEGTRYRKKETRNKKTRIFSLFFWPSFLGHPQMIEQGGVSSSQGFRTVSYYRPENRVVEKESGCKKSENFLMRLQTKLSRLFCATRERGYHDVRGRDETIVMRDHTLSLLETSKHCSSEHLSGCVDIEVVWSSSNGEHGTCTYA